MLLVMARINVDERGRGRRRPFARAAVAGIVDLLQAPLVPAALWTIERIPDAAVLGPVGEMLLIVLGICVHERAVVRRRAVGQGLGIPARAAAVLSAIDLLQAPLTPAALGTIERIPDAAVLGPVGEMWLIVLGVGIDYRAVIRQRAIAHGIGISIRAGAVRPA